MHDPLVAELVREHARDLAKAGERIAELEAALRDLLAHDDARFYWEGEPSEVEKRCRAVLENKQPKLI